MFSANIAKKDDSLNIQQKKIFYFISLFLLLAFVVLYECFIFRLCCCRNCCIRLQTMEKYVSAQKVFLGCTFVLILEFL